MCFFISLGDYVVDWLDHMVDILRTCKAVTILVFKVAVPVYIPASSV